MSKKLPVKLPTKKQVEAIIRVFPGPFGQGMTIKEAAKDLKISTEALRLRLNCFKKKFPVGWSELKRLRNKATQDRYELRWKRVEPQQIYLKTFSDLAGDNDPDELLQMFENEGRVKEFL